MSAVVALSTWPLPGERPMPDAPTVELPNGYVAIPQHYLRYRQTLQTVRALLADIRFDEKNLLFAGSDHNGLYLQAGLIGRENYDRADHERPHKLVYGRKWRLDADTPTSEIIQTAFLAIQKAYEHEVRELLTLRDAWSQAVSAPFSCHQDLPLLATNPELVQAEAEPDMHSLAEVEQALASVRFAQRQLDVVSYHPGQPFSHLVLRVGPAPRAREQEGDASHFADVLLPISLQHATPTALWFAVMDALLQVNLRWVEETFTYRGVARFSRQFDPRRIAALSVATRPYRRDADKPGFMRGFQRANYEVDRSRVPSLGSGVLAERNREVIARYPGLLGHMPSV